jgi:hypothetical protein
VSGLLGAFQSVALLLAILPCAHAQVIPAGFNVERYASVWERNPFAPATTAAPTVRRSVFDNLYLTSWLIDGDKKAIWVENLDTKEVQRIVAEPNQKSLRLIEMHPNPNPRSVEAVISDGKELGTIKFRYDDQPPSGSTASAFAQTPAVADPKTSGPQEPASPNSRVSRFYPGLQHVHTEGGTIPPASRVPGSGRRGKMSVPVPAQSNIKQN